MDLLQNPFHVLKATPRDNRQRIMELSEERSLLLDSNICAQSRSDLITPRKRISAEVAWLPGLGPKRAAEVLSMLESSVDDLLGMDKLTPTAKVNLLAAGLSRIPANTPFNDFSTWILELAWTFEKIDPEELRSTINEERIVSGFPEVTDPSLVEAEIQERRRHYRQVIKSALDKLSPKELVMAVTVSVKNATDNGEKHGPILIDDVINLYEVEAQAFLDKETRNIEALVENLKATAESKSPDSTLAPMVSQLIQVVKNWETVARPIQVSTKSRGLDHDASLHVARLVRSLAVYLFNEHGKLDLSQQLTNALQELFAKVVEVAERTAEDASALDGIAKQQEKNNRLYGNLSPISSAPSLSTINGIGFKLYGSTDTDRETGSYLSTYYFVLLFIPVFPIRRYRVISTGDGYRFLGKAPLRTFDKWHLFISLALVALLFVYNIIPGSNSNPTYPSSRPSSPNVNVPSPPRSYDNQPSRSALAQEITSGKTRAKQMEEQINEVDGRLEDYQRRMRLYRESDMADEHNMLVPLFNSLVVERRALHQEYSRLVDEVNSNVNLYNAGRR